MQVEIVAVDRVSREFGSKDGNSRSISSYWVQKETTGKSEKKAKRPARK